MIILALSICSLFGFDIMTSVVFTVIFSACGYSAVIYFKLKFAFYEDECEYIRAVLSKLIKTKKCVKHFFCDSKKATRHRKITVEI